MIYSSFSRLVKIASAIREDFEYRRVDYELLKNLYARYTNIESPDKFIEESKKLFPRLNCGLATLLLKHTLNRGEIIRGKYKIYSHTFLKLDNLILDITSDQFNGPKIYVGPLEQPWKIS